MRYIKTNKIIKVYSYCRDLVRDMVGTREGVIAYNENFRLDFENCCYKANMYEVLQQRIDKAVEYVGQELLVYDNESDEYKVGIKLLEILDGGENNR